MASIVSTRFVECHDYLKSSGKIRSSRQFAAALDYKPQNLHEILKGRRDVPLDVLRRGVEVFGINPMYLYAGEGAMFLDKEGECTFRVLTVVTDEAQQERIVHVPVPAQAGYSQEQQTGGFFEELPTYTLPDSRYSYGSHRSFDIAGDSMEPTLSEGDKVVCSFIEPSRWLSDIRDHHVYVVVTRAGVMIKRAVNNLRKHRHLELISDNPYYKSFRINVGDIREVWLVNTKLSHFSHRLDTDDATPVHTYDVLKETIDTQTALIKRLQQTIDNLMINV